jgi:glucose-6-phosphate 1-dehydrogenase
MRRRRSTAAKQHTNLLWETATRCRPAGRRIVSLWVRIQDFMSDQKAYDPLLSDAVAEDICVPVEETEIETFDRLCDAIQNATKGHSDSRASTAG